MKRSVVALMGAVVLACGRPDPGPAVRFTTKDGVMLAGWYLPAAATHRPTCVLIHGLGSTRGEWDPFIQRLTAAGFGVFAYDQRGHGASTTTAAGSRVSWRSFGPPGPGTPWEKLVDDVAASVAYLKRRGVPPERIVLIGASIGSSAALLHAARDPKLRALVLLSPGWEYQGLILRAAAERLAGKRIIAASAPGDGYAHQTVALLRWYAQRQSADLRTLEIPGSGHGVHLLDDRTAEQLLSWLEGV